MEDFEDHTQDAFTQSQSQHIAPEPIGAWGRLVLQGSNAMNIELLPRNPLENVGSATRSRSITSRFAVQDHIATSPFSHQSANQRSSDMSPQTNRINFMGLRNIRSFDRFNEYTIGRSQKCDLVVRKTIPKSDEVEYESNKTMRNTIHSMISNTHCRIFCLLKSNTGGNQMPEMEVYIEDCSGNGTIVNNTTSLKRNERRLLHTGDTICLLNPKILRKKVRDVVLQKELMDAYSIVFINVYQTQSLGESRHQERKGARTPIAVRVGMLAGLQTSESSSGFKRGLVDVRSTNSKSIQRHGPTATAADLSSIKKNIDASIGMMPPPEKKRRTSSADLIKKPNTLRRIEQEYDLRDEIGQGTCGTVRRAIHRKTGEMVAVKVIAIGNAGGMNRTISKVTKDGVLDPNIQAEASILQSLNHPYIVKLLDLFIHPGKAVYIVMELLHGGDLFDRIVSKSQYSEVESRRAMRRMLAAVHYLHQDRDIVHRDLKPENLLLVSRNDDVTVKLTDFGLAKSITEDGLKTFCGTPQYFAPEVLSRRTTVAGSGRYGKEADIWSLGVILYILICGSPPFDATMDASASTKIPFGGPIWRATSKGAIDLISKMLTRDPSKRITVNDACWHEWILTPDGDTHVNPLDDPVVLEAIGKKKTSSDERSQTPSPKKPPPEAPQSILSAESAASSSAIREIVNGETSERTPRQSNNKEIVDSTEEAHSKKESISPNQSALFPTPSRRASQTRQGVESQKRGSLFSSVKQLSNEGAIGRVNSITPQDDKDVEKLSAENKNECKTEGKSSQK